MTCNWNYVSYFRIHGIPLPPPILTEEERKECQLYRQQAIEVEKRIEERKLKKLQEKQKLQALEENSSHECCDSNDVGSSTSEMEVLEFIRTVLGDSHGLEDVDLLISLVSEELKKRESLGSLDSTYNDVDNISLNHYNDSFNLDVENHFLEDASVHDSINQQNQSSNKNEKESPRIAESVILNKTTDNSGNDLNDTLDIVSNITDSDLNNDESAYLNTELAEEKIISNEEAETISPAKSYEGGKNSPPRLIRSNTFTLDSPSPSILMYLRSLAVGQSDDSCKVSSKVVKNLNDLYWKEEMPDLTADTFPHLENGNLESAKDVEANFNDFLENNGHISDFENGQEELEVHKSCSEPTDEKILRAATIIQAVGRGFLVRRLMKTQKIKDLKIIIKEAVLCAWSLYEEQAVSPADIKLHERIIQQVTAACYELHRIFFDWSTSDRMALIRTDREKLKNPKPKFRVSRNRVHSESDSISTSSARSKSTSSLSRMTRSAGSSRLQRPTTLPSDLKVVYQQ